MFFVVALGRSGTAFLSSLLNLDKRAQVEHEANPSDRLYVSLGYVGGFGTACSEYLQRRFDEIRSNLNGRVEIYGECNGLLRYHTCWLERELNATVIHLFRDGRDFVRSAFTRSVYTDSDLHTPILPRDEEAAAAKWQEWTRFQRLCWYWDASNRWLLDRVKHRAQFEGVLRRYEYFHEAILTPTGVRVTETQWRRAIGRPRNTQKQQIRRDWMQRLIRRGRVRPPAAIPAWPRWPAALTKQFWDICGNTMTALGYD